MPLRAKDAQIEFYNPATGALRYTLSDHIRRISIREVARDEADDATILVAHDFADLDNFVVGDEVRVKVKTENDVDFTHIWTGVVDARTSDRDNKDFADLPIKAQDWVYWKLARTFITDVWENKAAGAILKDAVQRALPAAGAANIEDTPTTIKFFAARDESLLSVARRIAEIAGAEFRGDKDKNLHFFAKKSKSSGLAVDASAVIQGSFGAERNMAGFGNSVLVRGGTKQVLDQDNSGAPASYSTVTDTTRLKARVFVSKSKVSRVEIYTNPDVPSVLTGALQVRIQADNAAGTAPVDEADQEQDLAQKTLDVAFLGDASLTTFNIPNHIAPPGGYVWLIVQSDGAGGQRVGVNGSSQLLYKTYFEVPILARSEDAGSVATYGRHELVPVTDTRINNEDDAATIASAIVAAHKDPPLVGSYEASDMGLSAVIIGQTVSASFAKDGITASTSLIVNEKHHLYDANRGTYSLKHVFSDAERQLTAAQILKSLWMRVKKLEDASSDQSSVSIFQNVGDAARVSDAATGTESTSTGLIPDVSRAGFFIV